MADVYDLAKFGAWLRANAPQHYGPHRQLLLSLGDGKASILEKDWPADLRVPTVAEINSVVISPPDPDADDARRVSKADVKAFLAALDAATTLPQAKAAIRAFHQARL